ncbi:MAG: KEOPS complex subunit Cgi121 [Methanomicrobiaceae archaeon]|nr:KEOPS complex subunit Cgi121 [Methanomicrobiaceae archaeon]
MEPYGIYQAIVQVRSVEEFLEQLRSIGEEFGVRIVFFNADLVAGSSHVRTAVEHALRSSTAGDRVARSFEMEALLYASGSRQCTDAARFGIAPGKLSAFICMVPPDPAAAQALGTLVDFVEDDWDTVDKGKREILMDLFSISPEELMVAGEDRIVDLVKERVALLDVYR